MRLPGFTAEGVVPSYSGGLSAVGNGASKRLAVSTLGGTGYACTPDNRICVCGVGWDCLFCVLDRTACGDLGKTCTCDPYDCICM